MAKKNHMRIVRDPQSSTGYSAAILIKNVSPRRFSDGSYIFAERNFKSDTWMDLGGYRKRPSVHVKIFADVPKYFTESQRKKKIRDRALAGSPMLI